MIDIKHHQAIVENAAKLNKECIRLNAVIQHLKKDHEEFKDKILRNLEKNIRLYDAANEKVIDYLESTNELSVSIDHIKGLFPIKLG